MFFNKQASSKIVAASRRAGARRQCAGGRRDRNRAAGHELSRLDAATAQRYRESLGGSVFMNVVELDRATIGIGGRNVLSNVSFAIRAGEFIGVLGPNGAGKTTLMRAILGLLPPSAGTLRVFGRAPQRGDPADRLSAAGAHGAAGPARARARFHRQLPAWRALGPALAQPSRPRHDRGDAGRGRRARSRPPRALRHVGRRAATAVAGAGADRTARNCCCSTSR